MFAEDLEATKLAQLPGVSDLLVVYEDKFIKICMQLFEFGLNERLKRKEEIQSFFTSMHQAVESNRNDSVKHINNFEKLKSKVMFLFVFLLFFLYIFSNSVISHQW